MLLGLRASSTGTAMGQQRQRAGASASNKKQPPATPATDTPKDENAAKSFAARIKGLRGELSKYNGRLTRPKQIAGGTFVVFVPPSKLDHIDEKTEIILGMKNLDVVPDLEFRKLEKQKIQIALMEKAPGLGAAQTTRTRMEALTAQIRGAL